MTTVTESLELPGGAPHVGVKIELYLAGSNGARLSEAYADGETITGRLLTQTDSSGDWSEDLVPNADITPAGTAWARIIHLNIDQTPNPIAYIDVPAGTDVSFDQILTDPPGAIPSSALEARVAALEADLAELNGANVLTWGAA